MKNTGDDSPTGKAKWGGEHTDLTPFEDLAGDEADPGPKDAALKALEDQLAEAQKARHEERFLWIVVCVILVDVLWFRNAPNPTFPVVILVLEAIALFMLANKMNLPEPRTLFHSLLHRLSQR